VRCRAELERPRSRPRSRRQARRRPRRLGPIADRDVLVVDATGGPIVDGLGRRGRAAHPRRPRSRCSSPRRTPRRRRARPVVGVSGVDRAEIAEVDRVLRPGGRHLAVHEYGRDDVSRLHGDRPEYGAWSQRTGPFLSAGSRCASSTASGTSTRWTRRRASWPRPSVPPARRWRRRSSARGCPGDVAVYHRSRP
jgi:hypothetical protein